MAAELVCVLVQIAFQPAIPETPPQPLHVPYAAARCGSPQNTITGVPMSLRPAVPLHLKNLSALAASILLQSFHPALAQPFSEAGSSPTGYAAGDKGPAQQC